MRNKYGAPCIYCGKWVRRQEGEWENRWVFHRLDDERCAKHEERIMQEMGNERAASVRSTSGSGQRE